MKFLKSLQFIFMPSYWVMVHPYNKYVDQFVNYLLDQYEITEYDGYTCHLGTTQVWVGNRPYAVGKLWDTRMKNLRPSRLTIKRLLRRLDEHMALLQHQEMERILQDSDGLYLIQQYGSDQKV